MCPRCKRSKHPLVKTTFRPAACALRTARVTPLKDFTFVVARGIFRSGAPSPGDFGLRIADFGLLRFGIRNSSFEIRHWPSVPVGRLFAFPSQLPPHASCASVLGSRL